MPRGGLHHLYILFVIVCMPLYPSTSPFLSIVITSITNAIIAFTFQIRVMRRHCSAKEHAVLFGGVPTWIYTYCPLPMASRAKRYLLPFWNTISRVRCFPSWCVPPFCGLVPRYMYLAGRMRSSGFFSLAVFVTCLAGRFLGRDCVIGGELLANFADKRIEGI